MNISDTLDVYTSKAAMAEVDLVLQCWTMGELSGEQFEGLSSAVEAGTGLAGWHGGIVDSFRQASGYLQLTGGQFAAHPGGAVDYTVEVVPSRADHEVMKGLKDFRLHTEQYWVLTDGLNDVLATTTFAADEATPWHEPVTVPVIWTRTWGAGRVFVCTVGHDVADLQVPEVRTVIERGILWASR